MLATQNLSQKYDSFAETIHTGISSRSHCRYLVGVNIKNQTKRSMGKKFSNKKK